MSFHRARIFNTERTKKFCKINPSFGMPRLALPGMNSSNMKSFLLMANSCNNFFSRETSTVTIFAVSPGRNILACWNQYKHIFNQNFQSLGRISNHTGSIKRFFKPELKILLVLRHIWNTKICHLCLVHKVSHLIGLELSFMMLPLVSLSRALNILNLKSDHFSFCCLLFCWFSSIL